VENPADIFPRNACHCGKVALGDLLLNDYAPLADVTAERFCDGGTYEGRPVREWMKPDRW
jgi:hypothetical protein